MWEHDYHLAGSANCRGRTDPPLWDDGQHPVQRLWTDIGQLSRNSSVLSETVRRSRPSHQHRARSGGVPVGVGPGRSAMRSILLAMMKSFSCNPLSWCLEKRSRKGAAAAGRAASALPPARSVQWLLRRAYILFAQHQRKHGTIQTQTSTTPHDQSGTQGTRHSGTGAGHHADHQAADEDQTAVRTLR
jgi:hypothetical protein